MTLQEALRHCLERSRGCDACAEEHRQLAEWLKELLEYRMSDKKTFKNYSLTVIQIMNMSHALGIDNRVLGRQRYKPYRNYYSCAMANKHWEDLVSKGLAEIEDSDERGVMYRVSEVGRNILGRIFQMRIEEEEE